MIKHDRPALPWSRVALWLFIAGVFYGAAFVFGQLTPGGPGR